MNKKAYLKCYDPRFDLETVVGGEPAIVSMVAVPRVAAEPSTAICVPYPSIIVASTTTTSVITSSAITALAMGSRRGWAFIGWPNSALHNQIRASPIASFHTQILLSRRCLSPRAFVKSPNRPRASTPPMILFYYASARPLTLPTIPTLGVSCH